MDIGDAFLSVDRTIDDHLQIVISDPSRDPASVVIVGLTSYDKFEHEIYKDNSCLLDPDDHPWIIHQTCVAYRDGRVVSEDALNAARNNGSVTMEASVDKEVLGRILQGAEQTDELPNKCRAILSQQGLIED
ncbi:MAG: hypothetical protein HQ567_06925 [Candidatus Nealsonbacteria bacterium]|nr:hypothetical protein [Candidatus Nealsonbacteria bacterium]